MSQLRNALRAFAFERLKPSAAVTRLNRLLDTLPEAPFATLAFVTIDPRTGTCRYALAGHPPPLVRYPDGKVEYLEGGRSLPLGVGGEVTYRQAVAALPTGSIVVLYTDGLIERRDRSLEDGSRCSAGSSRRGRERRTRSPTTSSPRPSASTSAATTWPCSWFASRRPVGAAGADASVRAGRAAHGARRAARLAGAGRRRRHRRSRHRARDLGGVRERRRAPGGAARGGVHARGDPGRRPRPGARARWRPLAPERAREERGLGLRLMRSLMESVEVDRRPRAPWCGWSAG